MPNSMYSLRVILTRIQKTELSIYCILNQTRNCYCCCQSMAWGRQHRWILEFDVQLAVGDPLNSLLTYCLCLLWQDYGYLHSHAWKKEGEKMLYALLTLGIFLSCRNRCVNRDWIQRMCEKLWKLSRGGGVLGEPGDPVPCDTAVENTWAGAPYSTWRVWVWD